MSNRWLVTLLLFTAPLAAQPRPEAPRPTAQGYCEAACAHLDRCLSRAASNACVSACTARYPELARAGRYGVCVQRVPCDHVRMAEQLHVNPLERCALAADRTH
ncbi:MAG: hypothetical protein JNK72_23990 [Myxococcales bacterium]|nr:hypothetical protein [Myxococcales bacterium]